MLHHAGLRGKRAVITGAAGLVGGWIAQTLASAGCSLCLTDRDPSLLEAMAVALDLGDDCIRHPADLACDAELERLIEMVGSHWHSPDIVINNAGIYPLTPMFETTAATFDRILDVNLRAPFLLTRGFARQMVEGNVSGVFINLSSAAARKVRSGFVPYCASKAGLESLTRSSALELSKFGIRVNALEPGFIPGGANALPAAYVRRHSMHVPLGRVSRPSDIGEGILYLASDRSAQVTGTVLVVDGGSSLGDAETDQ